MSSGFSFLRLLSRRHMARRYFLEILLKNSAFPARFPGLGGARYRGMQKPEFTIAFRELDVTPSRSHWNSSFLYPDLRGEGRRFSSFSKKERLAR